MQKCTGILTVFILVLACVSSTSGQPERSRRLADLETADSLFNARQYTQAFDQYSALREKGYGSPSMFLKMAYIQEGLGHMGESLYYLNLYALSSHDPQAAVKMNELAEKNRLEGYQDEPLQALRVPLREYYLPVAGVLAALGLFLVALMFSQARRNKRPSFGLAIPLLLIVTALYMHVNYSRDFAQAIVTHSNTYLMSGPSSGSSVVEIIGEGHRLHIKGQNDVWLKVTWKDREAYVRDVRVRRVEL